MQGNPTGYRCGSPEVTTAWRALDFEYNELDNDHTLDDLIKFLKLKPGTSWGNALGEFRRRYGDIQGVWVCGKKKDAVEYYGEYGDPYKVKYDSKNVVIDLGPDGMFVLKPRGNPSGNHTYCRLLLKEVMADVRKLVPDSTIKAAWPYIYPSKKEMKQAEFQIPPEKFYWNGQACCKASAAYQGWRSYLRKKGLATNPGKNRLSKKASGGLSFGLVVGIGFIIYAIVKGREE